MTRFLTAALPALLFAWPHGDAQARSAEPADAADGGRYIVLFERPPLAAHMAAKRREQPGATTQAADPSGKIVVPAWKLDASTPEARDYLGRLDAEFDIFRAEAAAELGREITPVHRYRFALNGFSARLTADEAARLAARPGVKSVERDRVHKLHTDAGPEWIGADDIWNGEGFLPERRGEGIVIGIIDSGINWDHGSFSDPGEGDPNPEASNLYDHTNPFGAQLGLCSDEEVECNDKLVGVYDFVEDDPETEVVEENNNGFDNTNHGTLVAGIAAGNPIGNLAINGSPLGTISGVAPNANIVSYRVCFLGDPEDDDDDGCQGSAILAGIDQAVADGVDVINYSVGSNFVPPWYSSSALAFLNAVDAGIFVATSAGNAGPADASMGNPAAAPWIVGVGSATHDRLFASILKATQGGDTPPPGDLYGTSFSNEAVSLTRIVHAKDYGFPLCGTGEPAEDVPPCDNTPSASNPFPADTFDGEIVVCDRGIYGRVEKGKNLMLAGAGGYVLANTEAFGESIVGDAHCLPSTHIGENDGDILRAWLDSGEDHMGSITGFSIVSREEVADILSEFSSRGPNLPPVEDILKPNLIAPGDTIIGPGNDGTNYIFSSGTSFASPHVAGAAALLKSVEPTWTPSILSSVLELTATTELARDENGDPATSHEVGAGRPRLGEAANAGLYLDETAQNFENANPDLGGEPRELNLPSLTNSDCRETCTFVRRVKPLVGGRNWTATVGGFPAGVSVSVTPEEFTLLNGTEQELVVQVTIENPTLIGKWVYGHVTLSANNLPDAVMPVTIYASAGRLPEEWIIETDLSAGWQTFSFSGLSALPEATYTAGGLAEPNTTTQGLVEDPTRDDPYDDTNGVFTVLRDVPPGALWLHAETLASAAEDLDLFVGRDVNGNGRAEAGELVCESLTPTDREVCDIFTPTPGIWWIVVQNWSDGAPGTPEQLASLVSAVVGGEDFPNLTATGPGIVPDGSAEVRVAWENVGVPAGTKLLGAVGIGTSADAPNNVGVIPVHFERTGIADPQPLALFDGVTHRIAVPGAGSNDRIFVDVPPGVESLTISAVGASGTQNNNLDISVYRVAFDHAFTEAPFPPVLEELLLSDPSPAEPVGADAGSGGAGPQVTVNGDLEPGRYLVYVGNGGNAAANVGIRADLEHAGPQVDVYRGLWQPGSRPGISQGLEYNGGAGSRAVIWYSYGEDGHPTWYLASAPEPAGNVWTADILRFTNDGERQQFVVVGRMSITFLSRFDTIFTWTLFGESGSDRMFPTSLPSCPEVQGIVRHWTGLWSRAQEGLGGASVLVNANAQAQIHYLYDDFGIPRWLIAANDGNQSPTDPEIVMLQFEGYCPVCEGEVDYGPVGLVTREFTSDTRATWTLDYVFAPPLAGDVERTDEVFRLTSDIECE